MMNLIGICNKNVPYDNIKCHQNSRLHPLSRKHNFGKTNWGEVKLTPPAFSRVKSNKDFLQTLLEQGSHISFTLKRTNPEVFGALKL